MAKNVVLLKARTRQAGGLEKYASRIARGFAERGVCPTFLTTEKIEGYPCFTAKTSCWPAFRRMEQYDSFVRQWLLEHPAEIVFGMDRNRFQTHLRAGNGVHAAFLRSRLLTESNWKQATLRFNPLHRKILQFEKEAFEHPGLKKLYANSEMVRREILEFYATPPATIEVIHNGVEWEEMTRDFNEWPSKRASLLKSFGLDPSHFHFLFVGNGYLRKGLRQLLEALCLLQRKDVHLSVVGKESNLGDYVSFAHRLKLQKQVSFFGAQKEICAFYQYADALAIPSFYDPFANVTVEALAMGLFVVSSKQNGGSEILTADNGAVIENLLDPGSLAAALHRALLEPKSAESSLLRRNSIRHLDFSFQMRKLIDSCLGSSS